MLTRQLKVPKKYHCLNLETVEVVEFVFRPRLFPNGYYVTVAAIFLPSKEKLVFGASACAPEDVPKHCTKLQMQSFRNECRQRALGRAKKQAFRVLAGFETEESLIGAAGSSEFICRVHQVYNENIKPLAQKIERTVAQNAEARSITHSIRKLLKKHFNADIRAIAETETRKLSIRRCATTQVRTENGIEVFRVL